MTTVQPLQEQTSRSLPAAAGSSSTRLISADEVGRMLGIDVSTVYRMASDGRLPARKVGRQWRFPAEAVLGEQSALDSAVAQAVAGVAADLLGISVVVTDLAGKPVIPVQNPCPRLVAAGAEAAQACVREWRSLAERADLAPRFMSGPLGFECAAAFIRDFDRLLGLVIVGGVAPKGETSTDLFVLDDIERESTLAALPRIAAAVAERRTS